ncbi:MAG: DsbA family protein [Candidatus Paceibacteria bacterium]
MQTNTTTSVAIPVAIVIGFGLIAVAIYLSGSRTSPFQQVNQPIAEQREAVDIRPVDSTDYIRGNPNAPIMIVEYSDYDCPFCKNFHETMKRIMDEFGVGGQVAWVYRQYPIAQLHPNAPRVSEAALCVGELAGQNAFWTFSDLVFAEREVNAPTNMLRLNEFAMTAGADSAEFETCLDSGRHKATIDATLVEGSAAGIQGTPHSVIIAGNQKAPISGAQPYEVVRGIVTSLVSQIEAQ